MTDESPLLNLIGTTIGRYEILAEIGSGGMATIYRARQPELDRDVAIKILKPEELQKPQHRERFKREAQAIAKLRHPNILTIYDFGWDTERNFTYIVMEYVPRGTLKDLMGSPIPLEQVIALIEQIGNGLHYAHGQGIIHRDLKPSNILLDEKDRLLIADFGLAHIAGGDKRLTASGEALGTPDYMAPEQIQGGSIDARTDLYSLGIIVYEMVTGQLPYQADTPAMVFVKHVTEMPPPPHSILPDIPPSVESVILKALAREPSYRFSDVQVFCQALRIAVETDTLPSNSEFRASPGELQPPPTSIGSAVSQKIVQPTKSDANIIPEIRKLLNAAFDDVELIVLCQDMFPDLSDKVGRGQRKDEIIALIMDRLRRLGGFDSLLEAVRTRRPEAYAEFEHSRFASQSQASLPKTIFRLKFANRETEKEIIRTLLESDFYVQVHAPGGLGKTYLLHEIQRELETERWQTIWIDLASEEHHSCQADRYAFLQELSRQLFGDTAPDITDCEEDKAFERIGRRLAELDKIVLFIDNADRADLRFLEWLRAKCFENLSSWSCIHVVASGQRVISEWQGHRIGRPFRELSLSGFEDPTVIRSIINDAVACFGALHAKRKQETLTWQADLDAMVEGLFQIARGHPLVIERVLRYAIEKDRLMHATFFVDRQTELCDRCLAPIVGERILPTVDANIREAFRSLCVFRYVWPALIRTLTDTTTPTELGGPWVPFSNGSKTWENWWSSLQETHLLHYADTRQIYTLSPIVRQVIALVLQAEDNALYRARNRRARQEYERLLTSSAVYLPQRIAYLLEIVYHTTQDESLTPANGLVAFTQLFTDFLSHLTKFESFTEMVNLLLTWLHEDAELRGVVNQFAGPQVYNQLIEIVEEFVDNPKGASHE